MQRVSIAIKRLGPGDESILRDVAADVFDHDLEPEFVEEFLGDPRHHIVVALEGSSVVGMASGVHYVHPDKAAQLFVNELGVAPTHHRQGIGRKLVEALLAEGRKLGCSEAWVGTEVGNTAARGLYAASGGVEDSEPFIQFTFPLITKAP